MENQRDALEAIERHRFVVVIRTERPEQAYEAALACVRGGVRVVEITYSVPEAHDVIRNLAGREGVTVGAGTVLTIPEAVSALDAGASFIVSPHFDREIVKFAKAEGLVSIPGASTPTEILAAHHAGADIIKLFPFVEMGGLKFLKTIRGPLPFIKYMPSGGVTLENLAEYLAAGVAGVITGSAIIRPDLVRAGDWKGVEELAAEFVSRVEALR
ncbi:MAG: bifunctional 4-hydroxy-2-oxoglutarate aldolase/2-dehydro-3-deoxy-phosphogluconate aldolase [Thermodesulfovibrionales bacterium]